MNYMKKALLPLSIAFAALIILGAAGASAQYDEYGMYTGYGDYDEYGNYTGYTYAQSYYYDPLCPQGYDCAWINTTDVTSFGVARNNGNGHGFQYDGATQDRLCQIKGYERSIDGYNKTAKWSKCNNETHIEWRGYWYKYGCTSRTYLTNAYCIKPKQTSAPTISWSQAPSYAACDAQYTVEARGADVDGDLVAVSVDKSGTPFAYGGGGNGQSNESGNMTTDQGPKSVTYTAWATDSRGQRSETISHTVTIGSCQAPNQQPAGVVDVASCDLIAGWAYDPDRPSESIGVHFYVDGTFLTAAAADGDRPDVNSAFNINGRHGYAISTPSSIKNGQARTVQVYAIDANGGPNPLIGQGTVSCQPPARNPSGFIAVSPTSLPGTGGSVTVSWAVSDATSCTASGGWSGSKAPSGSQVVSVGSTTTFSLSCVGSGGSWSDSATVTVNPAPSGTISASPSSLSAGGDVTVSWSVSNATSCAASGGWSGVRSASGSQSVSVSQSTGFQLTCTGPGGSWSGRADVTVGSQSVCTDPSATNQGGPLPCQYVSGGAAQCRDGIDNDADGLIDMSDPGCSSADDNDEWNSANTSGNGGNSQPVPGFTVSADSSRARVQFLGEIGGVSEPRRLEANPVNGFSSPVTLSVASVRPKSGAAMPAGLEVLYSFDGGAFSASPTAVQSYNPSIGGGRYIGEQGTVGTVFRASFSKAVKEPYEVIVEGASGATTAQYVLTIEPYNVNPSYQEI